MSLADLTHTQAELLSGSRQSGKKTRRRERVRRLRCYK